MAGTTGTTPSGSSEEKQPSSAKPESKAKSSISEKGRITLWGLAIPAISSVIIAAITTVTTIASKSTDIEKLNNKTTEVQASLEKATDKADQVTVPPGTIMAYGGPIDELSLKAVGWLPCDGRAVRRVDFPKLFQIIQTGWGEGDKVNTFNLPDLRGYFLRGVSDGQTLDPDKNSRQSIKDGGNAGNRVGSVQKDSTRLPDKEFQIGSSGAHSHSITGPAAEDDGGGTDTHFAIGDSNGPRPFPNLSVTGGNHTHTVNGGGDAETRPKNAYVFYIIKY